MFHKICHDLDSLCYRDVIGIRLHINAPIKYSITSDEQKPKTDVYVKLPLFHFFMDISRGLLRSL